jgi:hypothetical protein
MEIVDVGASINSLLKRYWTPVSIDRFNEPTLVFLRGDSFGFTI